jgi:two-component system, chemotaxis family, CheB/CheR fusion protein
MRNTLAVVQAIAHQTFRDVPQSLQSLEAFDGRLTAFANAHELLAASNWQSADLRVLAADQLKPYMSGERSRVAITGDSVLLPADVATPLGLILHELATNALKHGALSVPSGRVELRWTVEPRNGQKFIDLVWRETNGPTR